MENFEIKPTKIQSNYYHHARPEIRGMIDKSAKRVLDVGCGAGILGECLKKEGIKWVTGVELNKEAADEARKKLDLVLNLDIENPDRELTYDEFDCIVFADVLEHLKNPHAILRKYWKYLKDDGYVVASIPNMQNYEIIGLLANGKFPYQKSGLLDETHLRFFTLTEIKKLFYETGYDIIRLEAILPKDMKKIKKDKQLSIGNNKIIIDTEKISDEEFNGFFAIQYLIKAKKRKLNHNDKKVTPICALHNQWEYTEKFTITSERKTKVEAAIFIDNASNDNTKNLVINIIKNKKNMGVAYAWNQGINRAHKYDPDYYLIINNDILWTPHLIERLLFVAEYDDKIGIVAPMSNYVAGHQLETDIDYSDYESLCKFTENYYQKNFGKWFEVPNVMGLCMLIKRKVIDQVGLFDERFFANYEDNDYCIRARQAGWKIMVVGDVFLHHYGNKSFENQDQYQKLLAESKKKFEDKWKGG